MTTDPCDSFFWSLIELVERNEDGSLDTGEFEAHLSGLSVPELSRFARCCDRWFAVSRTLGLWRAAVLIHDGAPEDTFDYFRSWLIGMGEKVFSDALEDPDSLAEVATAEALDDVIYCFAEQQYIARTGKELQLSSEQPQEEPILGGESMIEIRKHLPRLSEKFWGEGGYYTKIYFDR